MINDIINEQWQGHSHGEVEAALKLILQQILNDLEQDVEPGSVGREQLTQALKDAIDSIASKVPNNRRVNGKQLNADVTIGAGDIMVGSKTLSALLAEMQEDIDNAGGSGVTQQDIDDAIAALVDGAPETLDTFKELATALNNTPNAITALTNLVDTKQDALVAGNGIVIAQDGKTVSVDAEVVEPETADGTFAVRIGNNTYTIDLNHEHPDYQPKLTSANAGSNVTITTDPQTGEVTISAAGGGGGSVTIDPSITGANQANPVAGGAIYTALQGKANASEMSIDAVSGDSTKMTIQLKSGVSQNVVTEHQSLAGRVQSQDVVSIVKITQADYDALQTKDSTTLYLITES